MGVELIHTYGVDLFDFSLWLAFDFPAIKPLLLWSHGTWDQQKILHLDDQALKILAACDLLDHLDHIYELHLSHIRDLTYIEKIADFTKINCIYLHACSSRVTQYLSHFDHVYELS